VGRVLINSPTPFASESESIQDVPYGGKRPLCEFRSWFPADGNQLRELGPAYATNGMSVDDLLPSESTAIT
jgi:hypothetical protein